MPDPTLEAFARSGDPARSALVDDVDRMALASNLGRLSEHGVSLAQVTDTLEADGVSAFMTSYDELLATVASKLHR